jgi:hypothetical protein
LGLHILRRRTVFPGFLSKAAGFKKNEIFGKFWYWRLDKKSYFVDYRSNKFQQEDFMKKYVLVLLAILAVLAITGCTTTAPFDLTNNTVGSKVGESTAKVLFGGIFGGTWDYSIKTAAENGGITKIGSVDQRVNNVLNIIVTYTTIVTGE